MSDPWTWAAVVAAVGSGYFAILTLSIDEFSRAEIEDRYESRPLPRRVQWLFDQRDALHHAAAVWRAVFTVVFMAAVLAAPTREAPLGAETLALRGLVVFVWLWLVNVGLAWAVSEHAATAVVRFSLPLLPVVRFVAAPLTTPLDWLHEVVRRLVGAAEEADLEAELREVMDEGEWEGNLGETQREMIEAIVDFGTATVDEVMTPRIDINGIEYTDDLETIKRFVIETGHSRYPVYRGDLDHIEGILYVKDLLPYLGRDANGFELRPLLREAILVPESRRLSDMLVEFQQQSVHMAIVLDEYGGTAGLVTIEDIVEEIVGEIHDEHEPPEEVQPAIVRNDDGTFDVDGRVHIDDLNEEAHLKLPEDADFETIGGWVFATLGRIPTQGERFRLDGLEVTVLEAQRTHLTKLRLRPLDESELETVGPTEGAK